MKHSLKTGSVYLHKNKAAAVLPLRSILTEALRWKAPCWTKFLSIVKPFLLKQQLILTAQLRKLSFSTLQSTQ